jgi:WD40 repeat protein
MAQLPARVVISYARADGESLAFEIRHTLEACGLTCRLDHIDMAGGEDWHRQFESWVRDSVHLVLVLTPAALTSGHCAWEWQLARGIGRGVMPVRALPEGFPATGLRRWMQQAHQYSFPVAEQRKSLLAALTIDPEPLRVPDMSEFADISRHVERPAVIHDLRAALLDDDAEARPVVVGLRGAAGYGKTELAARVAQDPAVREAYFGGILYVKLGDQPVELRGKFNSLINAVSGTHTDRAFQSIQEARDAFATSVQDRLCLLVLDDAWRLSDVEPFLPQRSRAPGRAAPEDTPLNPNLSVLITTRDLRTLPPGTPVVTVEEMLPAEALHMLLRGVESAAVSQTVPLQTLAEQRFGRWPLLLQLGNGYIVHRLHTGEPLTRILRDLDDALSADGLDRTMEFEAAGDVRRRLQPTLDLSISLLRPEDAALYRQLAVFSLESLATVESAARLWGVSPARARELCSQLNTLSLLRHYQGGDGTLQLHMAIREVLSEVLDGEAITRLHQHFAEAWRAACSSDWRKLHDDYALQHLPWHLAQARQAETMRALLFHYPWLYQKLGRIGINAVISDYALLPGDPEAATIAAALTLSAHLLARETDQLAPHLCSRLVRAHGPTIARLLDDLARVSVFAPVRSPYLNPPGPELRRFEGHTRGVNSVVVLPGGRRALSASGDGTLRLWDIGTGAELRCFGGHLRDIKFVAVLPDSCRAVSASGDETLRLWDIETGTELRRFEWRAVRVNSLIVLSDGRRALLGCGDGTLRLWDIESDAEPRRFAGHSSWVGPIAMLPDGRRALSGSYDKTLRLWNIETGAELRRFEGHEGYINSIAVLPDGRRVLSASQGGLGSDPKMLLQLWDIKTGAVVRHFEGHTSAVTSVTVLPDGRRALSASWDKTLRLWDLETGVELHCFEGHTDYINSIALLPDGRHALSASGSLIPMLVKGDTTLRLWDIEATANLGSIKGHTSSVHAVAVLPDGRRAWSSSDDQTLRLWDLETGAELLRFDGHMHGMEPAAALPDGRRILSGSEDNLLRLWDLETGAELRRLKGHTHGATSIVVLPDGRRALSSSWDHTLRLWDIETGVELRRFEGHTAPVTSVVVLPDGRRALSSSWDHTLRLWDIETGAELRRFKGHTDWVNWVVALPDGRRAMSGSSDNTRRLWDIETGAKLSLKGYTIWVDPDSVLLPDGRRALLWGSRFPSWDPTWRLRDVETGAELRRFAGHSDKIYHVALLPDGRRALSSSSDGTRRLWDIDTGAELRCFARCGGVNSVEVLQDGRRALLGCRDGTLRLWDMSTSAELRRFTGHNEAVNSVAVLPDGRRALTGSADGTLRLWDIENGTRLRHFKGHESWVCSVAVLPDGRRALSASADRTLRLWDIKSGTQLRRFKGHNDWVSSIAVLRDGRRVLSGSFDHTLRLWDIETSAELRRFEGHMRRVNSVVVLSDGRRAVSGSADGTLRLWNIESGAELGRYVGDTSFTALDLAHRKRQLLTGNSVGQVVAFRFDDAVFRDQRSEDKRSVILNDSDMTRRY